MAAVFKGGESHEGFEDCGVRIVNQDVQSYFEQQYAKSRWRIFRCHIPKFKSKAEVDEFIANMNLLAQKAFSDDEEE